MQRKISMLFCERHSLWRHERKRKGKPILYCTQRVISVQKLLILFQAFYKANKSGKPPFFLNPFYAVIKGSRMKANWIK